MALLLDGQHVDESLVEHCSLGQFGDEVPGLGAAWRGNVDLFGEAHVPILQSIKGVVGANPHMSSGVVPQVSLCGQDVSRVDKVTINFFEAVSAPWAISSLVPTDGS